MNVQVGTRSDAGKKRRTNQDRVLARQMGGHASGAGLLLAVADGMGGGPAGEIASSTAIDLLTRCHYSDRHDIATFLDATYADINGEIFQRSGRNGEYAGMGTTLVCAFVRGNQLWTANVGDSRAYLLSRDGARQLTTDHSLVAEQVTAGQITEAEARINPRRNVITRSLGTRESVEVDVLGPIAVDDGSVLLLCSDGLYTMLPPNVLLSVPLGTSAQEAADRLVEAANDAGGLDNIAVVVARFTT